jgi:GNAT superfamily N-acetyltransferase
MFPLNPDLARVLVGFRIDDDRRRADHHGQMSEARQARRSRASLRGLFARRPIAGTRTVSPADTIRIAEANPSDRLALLAFLRELSPQTAYNRFVTRAATVDVVDVQLVLASDPCHRAVLALRGEEIVGHAHAVASPDDNSVELGVVVADEWQGRGIGPRLVRALLGTGPVARADELELFVLAWNARARHMINSLWPDAIADRDGELIHYRVHTARTLDPAVLVAAVTGVPCGTSRATFPARRHEAGWAGARRGPGRGPVSRMTCARLADRR